MHTVTKKDLALAIAAKTGCHVTIALKAADAVFETMREVLIAGNRIELRGFGVFTVKNSAARPAARNPRTGEIINVPARKKTHFKPGKEIKEAMKKPRSE